MGFLSLPPEIRAMVYEHVFEAPVLKMYRTITGTPVLKFYGTSRDFLLTCRTVNREARSLLEERTKVQIPRHLIRTRHTSLTGHALPASRHVAVESFTRNLVIEDVEYMCDLREIDLSAFQKLRQLEFKIVANGCCIRRAFVLSQQERASQTPASMLQSHWLDDPRRGYGLLRRIEQVEVKPDPHSFSEYNFRITVNPSRTGGRRSRQLLINYSDN